MADRKQAVTRAEVQELVDARLESAVREVTWLMAVVVPEIMKTPQWTAGDKQKLAAALRGVAESQTADGRVSAATAAEALAEALEAQARKG